MSNKLDLSIGPGLVTRWLSCFNWVLHHYHLLFYRANTARHAWRNREKQNDKKHYEKASFFSPSWVLEWSFCFVFGENVFLRSSHQEVFCEKDVLRNFAKFTARCFHVNFAKENLFLKNLSGTPFLEKLLRWLLQLLHFLSSFYYVICSCRKTFKQT